MTDPTLAIMRASWQDAASTPALYSRAAGERGKTVATHDLTASVWGHACYLMGDRPDGDRDACLILTPTPQPGDEVLLRHRLRPATLVYEIVGDVRTPADPGDQHFVVLHFTGLGIHDGATERTGTRR